MRNVIVLVLALMSSAAFAASDASQIQQLQNATKACKGNCFHYKKSTTRPRRERISRAAKKLVL